MLVSSESGTLVSHLTWPLGPCDFVSLTGKVNFFPFLLSIIPATCVTGIPA